MWGITARVAVQWGYMGPMRQLSQATAQQIAYAVYWEPYSLDALPFPIAFNVFDGIYNGGPAVKWLQEAVGGLVVDGNLGPITVAAVKAGNLSAIVGKFNALRLQYLTSLATWETFGKGWANRIANNLLKGLST
jgi:lysozyme family protein